MKRSIVVAFVLMTVAVPMWSRTESREAKKIEEKGDKLMKGHKYAKAAEAYAAAIKMYEGLAKPYHPRETYLKLGNAYVGEGDIGSALETYVRAFDSNSVVPNDVQAKGRMALKAIGVNILSCATCSWTLPSWEALVNVQRALGNEGKGAGAEQELAIHREANAAFDKLDKAGMAVSLVGAFAGGMAGTPPPDPGLTPDQEAETKQWQAKIAVYRRHDKPAYVAEATQMMREQAQEVNDALSANQQKTETLRQLNEALGEILSTKP
jgi:tetratricopeptide (TPR) repeat protein